MTTKPEMIRLFNKLDNMHEHITDIKVETAGIKAEFKALNGKVEKHADEIEKNRLKIFKIDKKQAAYAGGIAAIIFMTGLVIKFL